MFKVPFVLYCLLNWVCKVRNCSELKTYVHENSFKQWHFLSSVHIYIYICLESHFQKYALQYWPLAKTSLADVQIKDLIYHKYHKLSDQQSGQNFPVLHSS